MGIHTPGPAWAQVFGGCKSASLEFPWLPPVGDLLHAFYRSSKILSKQTNVFLAPVRHGWVSSVGALSCLTWRNPCTNTPPAAAASAQHHSACSCGSRGLDTLAGEVRTRLLPGCHSPLGRPLRQPWVCPHGVVTAHPPAAAHGTLRDRSTRNTEGKAVARASPPAPGICAALFEGERNAAPGLGWKLRNIGYLNKLSANKLESENSSQKRYGE